MRKYISLGPLSLGYFVLAALETHTPSLPRFTGREGWNHSGSLFALGSLTVGEALAGEAHTPRKQVPLPTATEVSLKAEPPAPDGMTTA